MLEAAALIKAIADKVVTFDKTLSDLSLTYKYVGYKTVDKEQFRKLCSCDLSALDNPESAEASNVEIFLVPEESAYSSEVVLKELVARKIVNEGVAIEQCNIAKRGYSPIVLNDFLSRLALVYVLMPRVQVEVNGITQTITLSPVFKIDHYQITTRSLDALKTFLASPNLFSYEDCSQVTGISEDICAELQLVLLIKGFDFKKVDLSKVSKIGISQYSIYKGQGYATVISCLDSGRLLYACEGNQKEDVQPFFAQLKALDLDENIRAFSCDSSPDLTVIFQEFLPHAKNSV